MKKQIHMKLVAIRITGIIWKLRNVTWTQKCVLAFIQENSFPVCRLSDQEIADAFGISKGRMANIISQLRKKNLLETTSFDGRSRTLQLKGKAVK